MRVFLAHGASGTAETMRPWIAALRKHGLSAVAVGLPRGSAERAVPAYLAQIAGTDPSGAVVGGHSFGGRVASLIAAEHALAGLILISYPLHRPGHPEQLRVDHWPAIACPTLLLSGESDPFARLPLLQAQVARIPGAELITYPRVGHGLTPVRADVVGRIVDFVGRLEDARRN